MTSPQLEAYVSRLARELKTRGAEDAGLVEEAREHLRDAVEDGRRRGLSIDAAEHEAFERFGAPEAIAARVVVEREAGMNRVAVLFGTVWLRKWWILVPTVVTALVTSTASDYLLTARHQRAAAIRLGPAGVLSEDQRPTASRRLQISGPMSIASLEQLVADYGLSDSDINVNIIAHHPRGGDIRADLTVRVGSAKQ